MVNDNKKISNGLKKIHKHFFNLFIFLAILFIIVPVFVNAQVDLNQTQEIAAGAGLGTADGKIVIGTVIKIALGFLGLIGLVVVIIAGFKWMTSAGNEEKVKDAKKMLLAGAAGMVVILFSYLIVNFIINKVQRGTGVDPYNLPITGSCSGTGCRGCDMECINGEIVSSDTCSCSGEQRLSITSYGPKGNNVKLCQAIQVSFSEDIDGNTASRGIKVYKCSGEDCTQNILGEITSQANVIRYKIDSYEKDSTYKVELLSNTIEAISGKKLSQNFSWKFNTGNESDNMPPKVISVFPDGNDICLKSHISVEFSEEMDKISLLSTSTDSFKLFKDTNIPTDFTFKHGVIDNKLILKPNKNFDVNTKYLPLLDGSKIMDSCGNKLDGNKNGTREDSNIDNYPSNGPSGAWTFKSGLNEKCEPTITGVSSDEVYYDGDSITINGQYLSDAVVVFDNQIIVNKTTELCIAGEKNKWPNKICKSGDWDSDSISLYIPATGGDLNGIRSGAIKVQTPEGTASASVGLKSPRIENISPEDGGKGQFVTIKGSGFGASKGQSMVVLRPSAEGALDGSIDLACGDGSWSDNQIIVLIPEDVDIKLKDYYFQVVKKVILQDEKWSNTYKFTVNDSKAGPGLCSVSPNTVKYNDNFTVTGVRLGDDSYGVNERSVLLGSFYNAVTSTVISWSEPQDGQDTKVTVQTPNLRKGEVGVRVMTQKDNVTKFSNSIFININVDAANQFKITYISPASSTVGSYITIYGSGFGNLKGASSTVSFKNGSAWVDGDFEFPSVCSTNYWKDDRIIVKVPNNFNVSSDLSSQIKVVKNKGGENQQETNPVDFIVNPGRPAPSICGINPEKGIAGDSVEVYGEYFKDLDKAIFSYNQNNNEININGTPGNTISVTVPETKTGLFVLHNDVGYGNTVNFEYGNNVSTTPTQTNWDFYGWHFATCNECKTPRVLASPCANGYASPSPRSGSRDVPVDARMYFAFEYSDGSTADINTTTLALNNFELFNCGSEENPICPDNESSSRDFSIENSNESSIEFSADSLFSAGNWYKFKIKSNRIYDMDNRLLAGSNNEIIFKINSNGGKCIPDTMTINPWKKIVTYEPFYKISYYDSLTNSQGCYTCNSEGYNYSWSQNTSSLTTLESLGSIATATLKDGFKTGTVTIASEASSSTLNLHLFASSTLKINLGCSVYNSETVTTTRQSKCIDENGLNHPNLTCCWNASSDICVDEGNSVCFRPYVKLQACSSTGSIIELGSPSPIKNTKSAPIDAFIYAQFGGAGGDDFAMNQSSFNNGLEIYSCGQGAVRTSDNLCVSTTISMNISTSTVGNNFVSYGHNNFSPNTWYKVNLKDSIADNRGYKLQPTTWYFKTVSSTCEATRLNVIPSPVRLFIPENKNLSALCSDNNCNICESNNYNYNWVSASNTIARFLENSTTNIATTTGVSIGSTTIRVHAIRDDIDLSSSVDVNVRRNCSAFNNSSTTCNNSGCCFVNNACSSNTTTCDNYCRSLNQSSCTDSETCCWSKNGCLSDKNNALCAFEYFTMMDNYPKENVCLNPMIQAEFDDIINFNSLSASSVILENLSDTIDCIDTTKAVCYKKTPISFYSYPKTANTSVLNIQLSSALRKKSAYRVRLLGSIRSVDGKVLNCSDFDGNISKLLDNDRLKLLDLLKEDGVNFNKSLESNPNEEDKIILVKLLSIDEEASNKLQDGNILIKEGNKLFELLKLRKEILFKLSDIDKTMMEALIKATELMDVELSKINQIILDNQNNIKGCSWTFKTSNSSCELSSVEIVNPVGHYYEYNQKDFEKPFIAVAKDLYGNPISNINGFYSWDLEWASGDKTLVNIVGANSSSSAIFKSSNKNGNTKVSITAKKKTPAVGYVGGDIKDEATVSLFMCNDPWGFEDYGFKLRYCMDGNLPELDKTSVVIQDISNMNDLVREYIFRYKDDSLSIKNGVNNNLVQVILGKVFNDFVIRVFAETVSPKDDLIGIRIYQNNGHLSPSDWYRSSNSFDVKGKPKSIKVGLYDAIVDGRTTYVNAGRLFVDAISDKISTNIYLISKNQNASPFTNNIYSQLVDNWQFNIKETPIVKENIAQDVKRWQDLRNIESSLELYANSNKYCTYNDDDNISDVKCNTNSDCINHPMKFNECTKTYPELTSGTYIRGITNSLWGSWDSNLGPALKTSLPKDPINRFSNCDIKPYNLDATTCFDSIKHIFICPRDSKVYYYETNTHNSTQTKATSYKLYALLNYPSKVTWFDNDDERATSNNIEISNINVCNGSSVIDANSQQ